jgi:exodeoxyribonuclease VII large subunit
MIRALSVSDLGVYLGELLKSDPIVHDLWVQGEVSEFKRYAASGHCYFTLKDSDALLRGVMWRTHADRHGGLPRPGDLVLAHGYIGFYPQRGDIQLYADLIAPAGAGLLHARFEELKARLEAEGLFSAERKRPLPALPRRVALVTAAQGAALQDMLTVLARRCPLVEVLVSPCAVQGERAPDSIVEALYAAYAAGADLVILARGGGSLEDLMAFNDEAVARAVFASPVPLITGVGHETDTTIVDYVADLRAPTPSAAAELAVPELADLAGLVGEAVGRMIQAVAGELGQRRAALDEAARGVERFDPVRRLGRDRQAVDDLARRVERAVQNGTRLRRATLDGLAARLGALSPQATLARGYAVVRRADDGTVVTAPGQAAPPALLSITLRDGELQARAVAPPEEDPR